MNTRLKAMMVAILFVTVLGTAVTVVVNFPFETMITFILAVFGYFVYFVYKAAMDYFNDKI